MKSSESIKNIAGAIVKAQAEVENLYPSSKGYGYDYVPLNKIIDTLKDVLPKHGLAYIQLPFGGQSGNTVGLSTRIVHDSGEWIEETAEFPVTDMKGVNATQKAGAAITYFRRYALLSAFGITGDKDVDANDQAWSNKNAPQQKSQKSNDNSQSPTGAAPAFAETPESKQLKNSLLDWIATGILQGSYMKKAELHMYNNDVQGMNAVIEWCKSQQKTA